MDMWMPEIHAVSMDRGGNAANEYDCAVRLDPLDNADVGQRIIQFSISVEVPGVVEEHQVAGMDVWPPVDCALLSYMVVNKPDAVGLGIAGVSVVEIDAVLQEDGACDTGAVVGDLSVRACDRGRAHERGRRLYDRRSAGSR